MLPEKEIMQGTISGACRQGRPRTAWMDDIHVDRTYYKIVRMAENRNKWIKYVHGMANIRLRMAEEQNSIII